jgi:RNA polymerase sigma-70 factor (ECF subfamily)
VDETQAIARLKRGDPGGLEPLVRSYQLQAVRAACLIVGDLPTAEDIVQGAFIRAFERIEQFDADRPFGPWFLRSVVNDAVKAAVRSNRFVPLEEQDAEAELDWIDPAPLPEETAETEDTAQTVWRALSLLSPDQRAAIVMRYYLELSEAEIADQMKRPLGTAKWWLFTARRRLARLLFDLRDVVSPPASGHREAQSGPADQEEVHE